MLAHTTQTKDERREAPTIRNFLWMQDRTNAEMYAGQWVALCDGQVIAQGSTRRELRLNLQDHPERANATAWKVE
jgi:hypothetical protein